MKIYISLLLLIINNAYAFDEDRMAPIGNDRVLESHPSEKAIDVSKISIKNFSLRMSEQDLIKSYPKITELTESNKRAWGISPERKGLGAIEKVYMCQPDPSKLVNKRLNTSYDWCGVTIGGLNPYNIRLNFVKNKLMTATFSAIATRSAEL